MTQTQRQHMRQAIRLILNDLQKDAHSDAPGSNDGMGTTTQKTDRNHAALSVSSIHQGNAR